MGFLRFTLPEKGVSGNFTPKATQAPGLGHNIYPMPNYPCEFEIPDAWLTEAGMDGFARTTPGYPSAAGTVPVPVREIEPPYRTPEKDWRGVSIARG